MQGSVQQQIASYCWSSAWGAVQRSIEGSEMVVLRQASSRSVALLAQWCQLFQSVCCRQCVTFGSIAVLKRLWRRV
jgi:TorA maturation chaperone TorD